MWGFFGPVLPTFTDTEEEISEVLRAMAEAGASRGLDAVRELLTSRRIPCVAPRMYSWTASFLGEP